MKARKRTRAKRKTQLDSLLEAFQGLQAAIIASVQGMIDKQEERILAASRSFDKVHDKHRDEHLEISRRLGALEQGRTSTEGTMAEIRRTVDDLRSLVDPLRALLDRLKRHPETTDGTEK